jgi:hypothetical protein
MAGLSTRPKSQNQYSHQDVINSSLDEDFGLPVVETLGYDGKNLQRTLADSPAIKITEGLNVTYIAFAAPGSLQSAAVWQCRKLDETTGLVITYADGNSSFDNVATDLTALSYS